MGVHRQMKRYPLFDLLRFLLAFDVARGHFSGVRLFPDVPAFLALSGFVVLQSFEHTPNWGRFAWKRFLRIYPALTAMLVIGGIVAGWSAARAMLLYFLSFGFSASGMNDALWSLPCEEVAYVLLAIGCLKGLYAKRWPVWAALGIGAVLCLASFAYVDASVSPGWARPAPLLFCFAAGNLAYLYQDQLRPFRWAFLPIMVAAGIIFHQDAASYPLVAMLAAPAFVLLGSQFYVKVPKLPDFSYSLYIWHYFWLHVLPWQQAVIATAVCCVASWYLIEQPAQKLKNRPLPRLWLRAKGGELPFEQNLEPVTQSN